MKSVPSCSPSTSTIFRRSYGHARRALLAVLTVSILAVSALAQLSLNVQPLTSFGNGDGWLTPAENAFLTNGASTTERGLAYNPTNNHLYITTRSGATSNIGIQSIDATDSSVVGFFNMNGVTGGAGGFINMISVTSDGVIYAANLSLTANGASPYKVYRWGTETDAPTTLGLNLSGLSAARLGDNIDLIGSDTLGTTRIVAGYNTAGTSGYAIIDPINLTTASVNIGASQGFRAGVAWVDSDTVWGITGGTLSNGVSRTEISGTLTGSMTLTDAGERPMDIISINGHWLLATVEAANSTSNNCDVRIYDITDSVNSGVSTRTLLGTFNLVSSLFTANANTAGSITWGAVNGDDVTLYAMSTNNGIQAFNVHLVPEPAGAALILAGTGMFATCRRRRARAR